MHGKALDKFLMSSSAVSEVHPFPVAVVNKTFSALRHGHGATDGGSQLAVDLPLPNWGRSVGKLVVELGRTLKKLVEPA